MKRAAALIIIFSLIFTVFYGCKDDSDTSDEPVIVSNISDQKEGILKLAYSKADMLDPFTSTMAANIQILGLVYDGLYKIDKTLYINKLRPKDYLAKIKTEPMFDFEILLILKGYLFLIQ